MTMEKINKHALRKNDNRNNGRYFVTIKHQIWGKVLQLYMHKKIRVLIHKKQTPTELKRDIEDLKIIVGDVNIQIIMHGKTRQEISNFAKDFNNF